MFINDMNNSPKFRDSKGNLAAYSFICGYVEEKIKNNILTLTFIRVKCTRNKFQNKRSNDYQILKDPSF